LRPIKDSNDAKFCVCAFSSFLQVELLRGGWSEIIALGLAQCSETLSLTTILNVITQHLATSLENYKVSHERFKEVYEHITRLQQITDTLSQYKLDQTEYAYLKALVLFSIDHVSPSQIDRNER